MSYQSEQDFKATAGYQVDEGWYPRVTRIVDIKSKPGLYFFYSKVGLTEAEKIKNKAADEGTMVHEAVESLMIGEEPASIPDIIKPSVDAFRQFMTDIPYPIEAYPELIEKKIIHHDYRYAGTADALVKIGNKFGLLDIKTSKAIWRDYNLQTSAYFDALKDEFKDLSTRWILRIDQHQTCLVCNATQRLKGGRSSISKPYPNNGICAPDKHKWSEIKGVVELKEITVPQQGDFEAFLGAKRLWEWENESILKRIGYL